MKIYLIATLIVVFFAIWVKQTVADQCIGLCPPTLLDILNLLPRIINTIEVMAGVVLFFMLVYNGYAFITSTGDREKIEGARKGIMFSIIGFAVIFVSFLIIHIAGTISGLKTNLIVGKNTTNFLAQVQSTFVATPLPSFLINTTTPTPYATGQTGDVPAPNGAVNNDACYPKVSHCDESIQSSAQGSSLDTLVTKVMNDYAEISGYQGSFQVSQVTQADTVTGDLKTRVEAMTNSVLSGYKLQGLNRFHAFAYTAQNQNSDRDPVRVETVNFTFVGLPVIAGIKGTSDYILLYNSNDPLNPSDITYMDPANVTGCASATNCHMNLASFLSKWNGTMLLLENASDPGDTIYTVFTATSPFAGMVAECIAQHESSFNPVAVNDNFNDANASHDPAYRYDEGMMQINEIHWGTNISSVDSNAINEIQNMDSGTKSTLLSILSKYGGILDPTRGVYPKTVSVSNLYDSSFNVLAGYYFYGPFGPRNFNPWSTYHYCW